MTRRKRRRPQSPRSCSRLTRPWSESELRLLRASFSTRPLAELRAKLPGRTANAISIRAAALGLRRSRRWTAADIDCLESLRNAGLSPESVSKALNRSLSAVSQKCRQLDAAAELRRYLLKRGELPT